MSSILLKLCVLAVILSVALASPLERERRASRTLRILRRIGGGFKNAAATVGGGAVGAFTWIFPRRYKEANTLDREAEICLSKTEKTIDKGKALVSEGEKMLSRAEELEKSLGSDVGKRDDDQDQSDPKGIRAVIQALRKAADRSIKTGKKIVGNSEKIAGALKDAVVNITVVVAEGVVDVGAAVVDVSAAIAQAGQVLERAKASADNSNLGLGDAIDELENAGKLVLDAGRSFEEVGRRSLTLVEKIYNLGKNVVQVIGKAAMKIAQTAGITGRK